MVHLPENLRGNGLGSELTQKVEEETVRRGCIGALLETYSFQARGFYERLGYEVYGTVEDFPQRHRLFAMQKRLEQNVP